MIDFLSVLVRNVLTFLFAFEFCIHSGASGSDNCGHCAAGSGICCMLSGKIRIWQRRHDYSGFAFSFIVLKLCCNDLFSLKTLLLLRFASACIVVIEHSSIAVGSYC